MGAIVGAGLLSHVPSIMPREEEPKLRAGGRDSTLPRALQDIFQERIQPVDIRYLPDFRYPLVYDTRVCRQHPGTSEWRVHLRRVAERDP